MSSLPRAARRAPAVETPEPPSQPQNLCLAPDMPPIIFSNPQILQRRTQADATMQSAQRRLLAGKRYYQTKDLANARREFDRAIDLMLEASDQEVGNRREFDRQLDEMLDSIHRYALSALDAAA